MFDKEIIERIIKNKTAEMSRLRSIGAETFKITIDFRKKEINYLNALLTRYKIAELLKLDKDLNYINVNYFGIEEEKPEDYNLTDEEKKEFDSLVSKLPQEQLAKFKIRKNMAEVLGDEVSEQYKNNNYYGIENFDPDLFINRAKYGLLAKQIEEFKDLKEKFSKCDDDNTKYVDISKEVINVFKDIFNVLNNGNEYENIKEQYLNTIEKLMVVIKDEDKNFMLSSISKYQFFSDLKEKYPELNIKLNMKGAESLLEFLETPGIDEDKYNEGIKLFCDTIKELYKDDNNKSYIENLLNSIDNNYALRFDLKPYLSEMKNINIGLKDSELSPAIDYLDFNYSNLEETTRNKCYDLVKSKIERDIVDENKAANINEKISNIKNEEFSERLQNDFVRNNTNQVNLQHLNSYKELVQDTIDKLENKKKKYLGKIYNSERKRISNEAKIKSIDKEIEMLKQLEINYDDSRSLNELDASYNYNTKRIAELKQELEELKSLKEQVSAKFKRRNLELFELQHSQIKILDKQKRIMAPKLWIERKKGMLNRHFESRAEILNEYAEDYEKKTKPQGELNDMFSEIKNTFYERKVSKLRSRANFNQKICEILQNSNISVRGYIRRKINKNTLNASRQNQQQQAQGPQRTI